MGNFGKKNKGLSQIFKQAKQGKAHLMATQAKVYRVVALA